jgi:hypothetical protein
MDASEVKRGMRVLFWPDFMKAGEVNELLTGKVKGAHDPEFPYMFLIKADDGRTYEVNADCILMRAP